MMIPKLCRRVQMQKERIYGFIFQNVKWTVSAQKKKNEMFKKDMFLRKLALLCRERYVTIIFLRRLLFFGVLLKYLFRTQFAVICLSLLPFSFLSGCWFYSSLHFNCKKFIARISHGEIFLFTFSHALILFYISLSDIHHLFLFR